MFSRFTEVLTVAMATSVESMCWRDFAEGNYSTLVSLQPSGSSLILFTSVLFHSGIMFYTDLVQQPVPYLPVRSCCLLSD